MVSIHGPRRALRDVDPFVGDGSTIERTLGPKVRRLGKEPGSEAVTAHDGMDLVLR